MMAIMGKTKRPLLAINASAMSDTCHTTPDKPSNETSFGVLIPHAPGPRLLRRAGTQTRYSNPEHAILDSMTYKSFLIFDDHKFHHIPNMHPYKISYPFDSPRIEYRWRLLCPHTSMSLGSRQTLSHYSYVQKQRLGGLMFRTGPSRPITFLTNQAYFGSWSTRPTLALGRTGPKAPKAQ